MNKNYPFSDKVVFCSKHSPKSDIIDVDQCEQCSKPGRLCKHGIYEPICAMCHQVSTPKSPFVTH